MPEKKSSQNNTYNISKNQTDPEGKITALTQRSDNSTNHKTWNINNQRNTDWWNFVVLQWESK